MRKELHQLEEKIAQLIQLNTRLRVENHRLRQELAQAMNHPEPIHPPSTKQENA